MPAMLNKLLIDFLENKFTVCCIYISFTSEAKQIINSS